MGEPTRPNSVGRDYIGGDQNIDQHAGGHIVGGNLTTVEAPKAGVAALHQLPAPPADFTGRTAELAELRAAVAGAAPLGAAET